MKRFRSLYVAMFAITAASCRDGVQPFTPTEVASTAESPRQLTFSATLDLNPTWSANSDTVYYSANKAFDYPQAPNTLMRIARSGGLADLLSPAIDPHFGNTLVLPVLAPTHDRIAYFRFARILEPANCSRSAPSLLAVCTGTEPLLETGYLRVRPLASTSDAESDVTTVVKFPGVDSMRSHGGALTYLQHVYPLQLAYSRSNDLLFRPSWSPDGTRLVFSTGLSLRTWNGGSATSDSIPNTVDGVSPAWSPVSNRIAFTRMTRGDSTVVQCNCYEPPGPPGPGETIPVHTRWFYNVGRAIITLIDPDGSNAVELVDGNEPAWSPDGSTIYFTREANIYKVPSSGGTPVRIEGTQFGRAPAVSPDGKWLAFAKYSADDKNSDIWVIRLEQQ
jgi:hypothetical protein